MKLVRLEPRRLIHIWVVSSNKCTDAPVVERGHPGRKLPTKHGLQQSESSFISFRRNRLAVIRGAHNRAHARFGRLMESWKRLTVMTLKNWCFKKKRPALLLAQEEAAAKNHFFISSFFVVSFIFSSAIL